MDYSRYPNLRKGINRKRRIAEKEKQIADMTRGSEYFEMTLDEFKEKYKAKEYDIDDGEFVAKQDPNHIWTWMDICDGYGTEQIESGLCRVNRVGYFISEIPFTHNTTITIIKDDNSEILVEDFVKDIDAIPNHIHPENGYLFKDTPEEVEFVKAQNESDVFTYYHAKDASRGFTGYLASGIEIEDWLIMDGFTFKGYFVAQSYCYEGATFRTSGDETYK